MTRYPVFSVLKKSLDWWLQGLLAWLPESLAQRRLLQSSIQCEIDGEEATLCLVNKQGVIQDELRFKFSSPQTQQITVETWLQQYKNYKIVLKISENESLIRPLTLPIQAKDNLDDMLKFEIDRQTPFNMEDVFYSYKVNNDDSDSKSLLIMLAVVPKQFVEARLTKLAEFSILVSALATTDTEQESQISIPLSGTEETPDSLYWVNAGLLLLAMILLSMLMYKPVWYYQQQIEVLQTELIDIKKQAQSVSELKKQNESLVKRAQFLTIVSNTHYSKVAVLNQLAKLFPDHTWLEFSEFNDDKLTLYGQSAAAADLIELLNDTGLFDSVRFIVPLTDDEQSGKERFKLEALFKLVHGSADVYKK